MACVGDPHDEEKSALRPKVRGCARGLSSVTCADMDSSMLAVHLLH